jgi:hypothetical protein
MLPRRHPGLRCAKQILEAANSVIKDLPKPAKEKARPEIRQEKQMIYRFFILAIALFFLQCGTAGRVLKQTDTTAVIQGLGPTEFEAKENATKKAEEVLGSAVKETQAAECSQEVRGSGRTSGSSNRKKYSSSMRTYHSCVLYFEKL